MRTHYCGKIDDALLEQPVSLCGWVHRTRDHGGVIFVDLRDHTGLVQVVFRPEQKALFCVAETLHNEYVIQVRGLVETRPDGTINLELPTGKIEVIAEEVKILNTVHGALPFRIDEHQVVGEETRLRYRVLDLRRPEMNQRLTARANICKTIRHYLDEKGFLDIETPFLTKATPEGARDYLVPSRVHTGEFYALPQSPQVFKQLLMMSGFDRYYQIVRCFRDEDLRADRQPEFTQLDLEMAFVEEKEVQDLTEGLMRTLYKNCLDTELPDPFPRMTYAQAMSCFGSDRPDLRIPLKLISLDDLLKTVDFKVFSEPANEPNSRVAAICLPEGGVLSRKAIDDYTDFVKIYGASGLAYIKVNDKGAGKEGLQSPIVKFLPDDVLSAILERVNAQTGDIIFFGAGHEKMVNESLGALRIKLGHDCKLIKNGWEPLWVVDFPLFEWNAEGNHWQPLHHPFTAPAVNDADALLENPAKCLSRAYDIVMNGSELGGGSIRVYDKKMQLALFKLLNLPENEAHEKFGHLLRGLDLGCPPHGGIALGIDRIVMMMTQVDSIREVIAFPKTQTAQCLLTNAPSHVSEAQLNELSIRIKKAQYYVKK